MQNLYSQIYANITSVVSTISNKMRIEVLGVELVSTVLKTIAANLEVSIFYCDKK